MIKFEDKLLILHISELIISAFDMENYLSFSFYRLKFVRKVKNHCEFPHLDFGILRLCSAPFLKTHVAMKRKLRDLGEYETIFNFNCNFHCSSIKQKNPSSRKSNNSLCKRKMENFHSNAFL